MRRIFVAACAVLGCALVAAVPTRADDDDNVVTWHNLQASDEDVDPNLDCSGAKIEWSLVTFELNENDNARQRAEDAGDDDFANQVAEASAHGQVRQEKLQQIIDSKCPK
jgi:hypothetical protein